MTFDDLKFNPHKANFCPSAMHAELSFDNGFGISVITSNGEIFYVDGSDEYEIAVTKNGRLAYQNPVAKGDVIGHLSAEGVTEAMKEIQSWDSDQRWEEPDGGWWDND